MLDVVALWIVKHVWIYPCRVWAWMHINLATLKELGKRLSHKDLYGLSSETRSICQSYGIRIYTTTIGPELLDGSATVFS